MQFSDISIELPIGKLLIQNIVLMVVPITVGFVINLFRPTAAERMHAVLKRIAMPALVLLVTVFFVQHKQTIVDQFGSLGLTMTVLILATTACGALLAWLLRLTGKERQRDHRHPRYHLRVDDEHHPAGVRGVDQNHP